MSIYDDVSAIVLAFSYTEHFPLLHDEVERVLAWLVTHPEAQEATVSIESQSGATRYRVDPTVPCAVQMQTGPGKSWVWHSTYRDAAEAQAAVLRLGRGRVEQEETA